MSRLADVARMPEFGRHQYFPERRTRSFRCPVRQLRPGFRAIKLILARIPLTSSTPRARAPAHRSHPRSAHTRTSSSLASAAETPVPPSSGPPGSTSVQRHDLAAQCVIRSVERNRQLRTHRLSPEIVNPRHDSRRRNRHPRLRNPHPFHQQPHRLHKVVIVQKRFAMP